MPAKLKVYRTAIGFHDAYVAAPSQKAALEAWGTDKPLFTRGAAELVTDPALTAEPLASPGVVIKKLRATAAEQVAALPPSKTRRPERVAEEKSAKATTPKPSRRDLDAAESALTAAEKQHERARDELAERERALAADRRALAQAQERERERLTRERDRAAAAYQKALAS